MEKIIPLGNRCIIEFLGIEEKTESGLILPTQNKEDYDMAKVIEVGVGVRSQYTGDLIPMTVKNGDIICLNPHSARFIKMGVRKQVCYVNEHDIIAIIRDMPEGEVVNMDEFKNKKNS